MGGKRTVIEAEFVARLTDAHEGRTGYLFGYNGMAERAHVICFDCGHNWWARAGGLVDKYKPSGCPTCGHKYRALKRFKTTEQYIEDLHSVHGDLYDLVGDYLGTMTKTLHNCKQCNETWDVTPSNLLQGNGCPTCADYSFDPSKPAICYYLRVSSPAYGELYKIGITNKSVEKRFTNDDLEKITTVKTWSFNVGSDARDKEREILAQHSGDRYTGEDVLGSNGNTEMFTRDILELDHNLCH